MVQGSPKTLKIAKTAAAVAAAVSAAVAMKKGPSWPIIRSHADNQVAGFRIMLEASSPNSASIPDSASHYHFKVEVDIRFEGGHKNFPLSGWF